MPSPTRDRDSDRLIVRTYRVFAAGLAPHFEKYERIAGRPSPDIDFRHRLVVRAVLRFLAAATAHDWTRPMRRDLDKKCTAARRRAIATTDQEFEHAFRQWWVLQQRRHEIAATKLYHRRGPRKRWGEIAFAEALHRVFEDTTDRRSIYAPDFRALWKEVEDDTRRIMPTLAAALDFSRTRRLRT